MYNLKRSEKRRNGIRVCQGRMGGERKRGVECNKSKHEAFNRASSTFKTLHHIPPCNKFFVNSM